MGRNRFLFVICAWMVACGGDDGGAPDSATPDGATDATTNDSPSDAALDAPNEIPQIAGLVLWLDASKGLTTSNGSVTAWADQSPAKNDAAVANAKLPPSLATVPINGFPAVHFHAGGNQVLAIKDAVSLQWGTGDYAIATVARFDNDPTSALPIGAFYVKIGGAGGFAFLGNAYVLNDANGFEYSTGLQVYEDNLTRVATFTPYDDAKPRLYLCRRTSGSIEIRVNGASVVTSPGGVDVSNVGSDVGIGASTQGADPLDGDIAELVAVKGTLGPQDLASLEAYWTAKYGL